MSYMAKKYDLLKFSPLNYFDTCGNTTLNILSLWCTIYIHLTISFCSSHGLYSYCSCVLISQCCSSLLSIDLNNLHHLPPNFIGLLLDSPSQPSFRRQQRYNREHWDYTTKSLPHFHPKSVSSYLLC